AVIEVMRMQGGVFGRGIVITVHVEIMHEEEVRGFAEPVRGLNGEVRHDIRTTLRAGERLREHLERRLIHRKGRLKRVVVGLKALRYASVGGEDCGPDHCSRAPSRILKALG